MANEIKTYDAIRNYAEDGKAAFASQIYDEHLEKFQQDINSVVDNGFVYDISAAHNNTKYADLSDALGTNGGNIPKEYRKGGITVRYVRTSDNKYVQYRLMSDTFNTTVANWQGVDDEPTVGSSNLIKSDGVAKFTNLIPLTIGEQLDVTEKGYYIPTTGDIISEKVSNGYYNYTIVDCSKSDVFILNNKGGYTPSAYAIVDSDGNILEKAPQNADYTNGGFILKVSEDSADRLVINYNYQEGNIKQQAAYKVNELYKNVIYNNIVSNDFSDFTILNDTMVSSKGVEKVNESFSCVKRTMHAGDAIILNQSEDTTSTVLATYDLNGKCTSTRNFSQITNNFTYLFDKDTILAVNIKKNSDTRIALFKSDNSNKVYSVALKEGSNLNKTFNVPLRIGDRIKIHYDSTIVTNISDPRGSYYNNGQQEHFSLYRYKEDDDAMYFSAPYDACCITLNITANTAANTDITIEIERSSYDDSVLVPSVIADKNAYINNASINNHKSSTLRIVSRVVLREDINLPENLILEVLPTGYIDLNGYTITGSLLNKYICPSWFHPSVGFTRDKLNAAFGLNIANYYVDRDYELNAEVEIRTYKNIDFGGHLLKAVNNNTQSSTFVKINPSERVVNQLITNGYFNGNYLYNDVFRVLYGRCMLVENITARNAKVYGIVIGAFNSEITGYVGNCKTTRLIAENEKTEEYPSPIEGSIGILLRMPDSVHNELLSINFETGIQLSNTTIINNLHTWGISSTGLKIPYGAGLNLVNPEFDGTPIAIGLTCTDDRIPRVTIFGGTWYYGDGVDVSNYYFVSITDNTESVNIGKIIKVYGLHCANSTEGAKRITEGYEENADFDFIGVQE